PVLLASRPVRSPLSFCLAAWTLLAAWPAPAGAWGFTGHRLVNRKAVLTLPSPVRELFAGNADYLAEHSIDPDLWRAAGLPGEGPNHYLDLDAFGEWPFAEVHHLEARHLARFGAAAREKGRVPWRVLEEYRDLVEAFRASDPALVLERAAVLGHYVADAHVPLHAILNYDGQLTGQQGIHARYESEMVDRYLRQIEPAVAPGQARSGAVPVELVFGALLESAALTDEALRADRESAGPSDFASTPEDDRYADPYYSALFEREGPRLTARLSLAAERLGALWLTAWEEAGRPPVPAAVRVPYVRGRSRLIVASLDGAAAPVVADAVARGVMPELLALRAAGATATGSVTSWPAKTASGHATLYTGAWPEVHGVTGNEVVLPEASILEPISGFRSEALRAEPLWVAAARQGLQATLLCATQDYPYEPYEEGRRFGGDFANSLTFLTGYKGPWLADAAYRAGDLTTRAPSGWPGRLAVEGSREIELRVGDSTLYGLLQDDPDDPAEGFDTLVLAINKDGLEAARLKPASSGGAAAFASVPVRLRGLEVPVFFRLFSLSGDGRDLLLYQARAGAFMSNHSRLEASVTAATGGFVGNGASRLYEVGRLGPTLPEGGDGSAEHRYLETARLTVRQFERLLEFGARRTPWQVLVGYLPFPDEFLHLWWGYLDPTLPGHDPVLAGRLRPFLDEGLRIADGYVGALRRHADGQTVVAIGADHGMSAVRGRVRMNAALRNAGLLALDASGRIDLARTKVYYLAASGYFLLNRASRPGGIVLPGDEASVRAATGSVLRGLRDPRTGEALVTEVLAPGVETGLGGPQGGDVYFRLVPHVFPDGDLAAAVVYDAAPGGEHLLEPTRPEMHASFVVAGPGVATGELGVIRQVDIAPTLAALLGLRPPAQSSGAVLSRALQARGEEGQAPRGE
ncbi:MAG TPA: alkaline phosphatase family protein, partial [Vicinamibacteria bacterium]